MILCQFQFLFVKLFSFSFSQLALSQLDFPTFSDRQHEESRQHAMSRFLMILQDQESVNFAQSKTIKSHVFCLFPFLKPACRSLTHFSPYSAHRALVGWFFDETFIRNSQRKKNDENFECFWRENRIIFLSSV
jgi:hypothetical protein